MGPVYTWRYLRAQSDAYKFYLLDARAGAPLPTPSTSLGASNFVYPFIAPDHHREQFLGEFMASIYGAADADECVPLRGRLSPTADDAMHKSVTASLQLIRMRSFGTAAK